MSARLRNAAMRLCNIVCFFVLIAGITPESSGQELLRDVINRELRPTADVAWPKASDAEFLRRVSLDLNGMPPGADEARMFLQDTDPAKREKLVDRLLVSPLYDRHLATTLDVMLMERRPNTHVPQDTWMAWLLQSVRENKPWNVLTRELLSADGNDPDNRGPARFYLDRGSEPHVITRDIGRIFYGRDLQCCQCHDSPLVSDYLQRDYQGLLAFSMTGYPVTKKVAEKDVTIFAERAASDVTFESVFNKGSGHRTSAKLPGIAALAEPVYYPGEEYDVPPADGVRSVPKFSRRMALAELSTNGSNQSFNENIANRLWAMMLGRGLVHPLDMMHPDNPAASPELLKLLGERFAASGFDIRSFLREVALSDVYQRPFDLTPEVIEALAAASAEQQSLAAEKELLAIRSRELVAASSDVDTVFDTAESAWLAATGEVDKARAVYADAKSKQDEAQKALDAAIAAFDSKKLAVETLQQAVTPLESAVNLLADNPELATALKTLGDKVAAVATELPTLEKSVAEKSAAMSPVSDAVAATRAPLDAAIAAMTPLQESMHREQQRVVVARAAMLDARWKVTSAESRLSALRRLSSAAESKSQVDHARIQLATNESALVAETQQMPLLSQAIAESAKAVQQAEQEMSSSSAAVATSEEQASRLRSVSKVLEEATAALRNAHTVLPDDGEIARNIDLLTAKTSSTMAMLSVTEQSLVAASQKSTAAADQLKSAQKIASESLAELQQHQQRVSGLETTLAKCREQTQAAASNLERMLKAVPNDLAARFALSELKPLTPEQMCWTIFQVTTVYDRYVDQEVAELEKSQPLTDEQRADPATIRSRAIEVEQRVFNKLAGNVGSYVQIYGGAPGQAQNEFYASPDQALFTANGGAINSWIAPAGDNPAERIVKATDSKLAAEELYLGVLTRMPSEEETTEVVNFLAARPDRNRAAQELVWGLISSVEFRFNR